ncbi:hypothetical protein Y032_0044g949 [Ancylostoma ceylanicum]|uniref:Uncharacterized protein n=1 Tax=Ancylostoma ceylanicum TaxID=53326 RepID=A0A016UEL3_9BILA|nr:hypothetical protein Y032_0044g949 [Ancylostoma ceylanicum]
MGTGVTVAGDGDLISKDTSLRISLPRTEATAERIPVTSPHDIKCFVLDNRKEVSIRPKRSGKLSSEQERQIGLMVSNTVVPIIGVRANYRLLSLE